MLINYFYRFSFKQILIVNSELYTINIIVYVHIKNSFLFVKIFCFNAHWILFISN